MEIRVLEYVREVGRTRNFTQAAANLCVAQPSLSQQVAKLEDEIGVKLFQRGRGPVVPTSEGIRFLEKAEQILGLHEDLILEMRERSSGMERELTIGAPAITGGRVLPPLLETYVRRYPQVEVRLVEDAPDVLEQLTSKGLVDLSILALPIHDQTLEAVPMFTEPILAALPRRVEPWMPAPLCAVVTSCNPDTAQNDASHRADIQLEDFASVPWVLLKSGFGFRQTVLELCAKSGFRPQIAYETSNIETAQSMVAHGLGVTLLPAMVQRKGADMQAVYVELAEEPRRTMAFVHRKERYVSLAARAMMEVYQSLNKT